MNYQNCYSEIEAGPEWKSCFSIVKGPLSLSTIKFFTKNKFKIDFVNYGENNYLKVLGINYDLPRFFKVIDSDDSETYGLQKSYITDIVGYCRCRALKKFSWCNIKRDTKVNDNDLNITNRKKNWYEFNKFIKDSFLYGLYGYLQALNMFDCNDQEYFLNLWLKSMLPERINLLSFTNYMNRKGAWNMRYELENDLYSLYFFDIGVYVDETPINTNFVKIKLVKGKFQVLEVSTEVCKHSDLMRMFCHIDFNDLNAPI